jgi:flavodoxin
MSGVVVYESVYGNTRAIAEAIAEGMGGAEVIPVSDAGVPAADLLVVGGPTHMHGLASSRSRQAAADAGHEDGTHVEAEAVAEPGLRSWLRDLPDSPGAPAASFDTRIDRSAWVTGMASRGIAKRLGHHGYEIVGTESFLVKESEGPLEEGELERARAWGASLAQSLAMSAGATS